MNDDRSLPEIAQGARREHQQQPSERYRFVTEVTHVGIQRLGASDGQEDSGQCKERKVEMLRSSTTLTR